MRILGVEVRSIRRGERTSSSDRGSVAQPAVALGDTGKALGRHDEYFDGMRRAAARAKPAGALERPLVTGGRRYSLESVCETLPFPGERGAPRSPWQQGYMPFGDAAKEMGITEHELKLMIWAGAVRVDSERGLVQPAIASICSVRDSGVAR